MLKTRRTILQDYQERVAQFISISTKQRTQYNRLSLVRLLVFIAAIFLSILIFSKVNIWACFVFILIFLFAFGRFIFWHREILEQSKHNKFMSLINEEEVAAMSFQFQQFDDGERFIDVHHSYVVDMDIFGSHSLFQYFNRTATVIGAEQLATYLSTVASKEEILLRQKAVKELSAQLDWRQHFQAHGKVTTDNAQHLVLLDNWLSDAPFVNNNRWLKIALVFVPIWMIVGLSLSFYHASWLLAIFFILLPNFIINKTKDRVKETHNRTTHAGEILSFYAQLIKHIEGASFHATKLTALQQYFFENNLRASIQIKRLSYIIRQLNVRYNFFATFFNLIGLWDLFWVRKLEQWKSDCKDNLPQWFEGLKEFEALLSLATIHHNNPDWTFPVITETQRLEGKHLSHPLIPTGGRVGNDFKMPTKGHIKLITGSNMAGKSTFLRTVGVNIILAMAGSAVCAKALSLPLLRVYSSMRTQDALHESTSSFYAELKRLKLIIEAVESNENVLFLLDEILKGTNSRDRHTGSRALIEQMIKSKGAGLIATHDLELGDMEASSEGTIENLCMEVAVENGVLQFDYQLKKGISQSFNATILMKEMGIDI